MTEKLIDWSQEGSETFAYSPERVAKMLAKTRSGIEFAERFESRGELNSGGYDFAPTLDFRRRAVERWRDSGDLAIAATRMLDIARHIDGIVGLDYKARLEQFLAEVGGEQNFHLLLEALSCGGALSRIVDLIVASEVEVDLCLGK